MQFAETFKVELLNNSVVFGERIILGNTNV